MAPDKDGGTAFPSHGSMGEVTHEGMSLRDYIAIRMLPVCYAEACKHNGISRADVIGEALVYADDYLKARGSHDR